MVSTPLKRLTVGSTELPIDELKTATSVDLHGKALLPTDAIIIASLVSMVNSPLKRLTLNRAELPIDELKAATSVYLSRKELKHTDAIIIASLISMVNTPLTKLNLRSNNLDEAAKTLIRDSAKEGMSLDL